MEKFHRESLSCVFMQLLVFALVLFESDHKGNSISFVSKIVFQIMLFQYVADDG